MDVLNDVLSSLRLSGGVVVDGLLTGDFCLQAQFTPEECAPFFTPPEMLIGYHYVRDGEAIIHVEGLEPEHLAPGDIAILPRNDPHLITRRLGLSPVSPEEITLVTESGVHRLTTGTEGPAMQMWCGVLGTDKANAHPIFQSLPPLLILRTRDRAREWLDSSLRFLAEGQPSPEILARLAELFIAQAIQDYIERLPKDARGWLRGLSDPAVSKALSIIHSRYAEDLDVEGLAREAGVSRSVLGERFVELLGEPPMRYCARWRMRIASNMLREGKQNTANIAYAVGFNSEAAFNRAFKREYGEPPATWRRRVDSERLAERAVSPAAARRPEDLVGSCTTADGLTIAYASCGEGFPVVKAPTSFTNLQHDWSNPIQKHWLAELSQSNRLVRCDMRGFGMSGREVEQYALDSLVSDLSAVIDASGVEVCDLVGLTHGAAIAIAYAARFPERVRKLVLLNSFARGWAVRDDPDEIAWRKSLIEMNRKRWQRDGVALGERVVSIYFPSAAGEMIDWHKERFDDLGTAENLEAMLQWGANLDIRLELAKVRSPALVFHSKHDGNAAVDVGREVAEGIANSRFVELDSANHFILEDEPAWPVLVREMRTFLEADGPEPVQLAPMPNPA